MLPLVLILLAAAPAADARPYSAELLAHAQAQGGAGFDKGFWVGDGGANKLVLGGMVQTRYLLNFRDEAVGDEDITNGFQARRVRLRAGGTIFDPALSYFVQGEFSRSTGVFGLLDSYGAYKWDNGMSLRFGQFKVPFAREDLVGDHLQLTAERSNVNTVFAAGRSQAVELSIADGPWRIAGVFSDGANALNTDFTSMVETDWALTGRADWRFSGDDWKRFDDHTSFRNDPYAGMLGAAIHARGGGETGGTADVESISATADVTVEGGGWNVFGAGVWRHSDAAGLETDDFGLVAQAGVFVTEQAELFARYDVVFADAASGDDFSTLTAGVNYYVLPQSHAFKLTADVLYYFDAEADTALIGPNTGVNLLSDAEGGQVGVRLQAQVIW
jgi:hypothetical protein